MRTGEIKTSDGSLSMSKAVLGAGGFGSELLKELSFEMMDRYFQVGGRTIDTGRIYMAWVHNGASKSEKTVGEWIRTRGVRDQMVVVTKGGHPELRNITCSRLAPECIEYDINTSLAVLGMDYVDVYFLHRDDERIPVGEIMDAMDQLVKDGLTRAIGASNWTVKRILEANEYALKHGKTPFTISQLQWNMADCKQEDLLDKTCLCMTREEYEGYQKSNLPVMAYSSQAVGFFSKYINSGATNLSARAKVFLTEKNIKRAQKVEMLCRALNCTPAALCIAFISCNPVDGYAIIGNSSMQQMEDSLTGVELTISQEEIDWIVKD
jgi:aryl-alcohol dehydrogenase-like predicted oxidoreductase